MSANARRHPLADQSLAPPAARVTTNEFDPPELRRGVSIDSLKDEFRQQAEPRPAPKPKDPVKVDSERRARAHRRPARLPFFGGSKVAPHPGDNPDLFLAIVNARGIVRQSIADLCQNLHASLSAQDARLVSFIRRRESTGIRHEFVLIQARYPNSKTIWMRLERGVKGSISIFRLKATAPADDVVSWVLNLCPGQFLMPVFDSGTVSAGDSGR